jgi:hypothetical protein
MIRKIDAAFVVIEGTERIIIKNVIDPEGGEIAGIGATQETRSGLAEGIMIT